MQHHPKTAYLSLWLPLPSETFIFREILELRRHGVPVVPYSIYGPAKKKLSREMLEFQSEVRTNGLKSLPSMLMALAYWYRKAPAICSRLVKSIPFRRWRSLESAGENIVCFVAGFHLARLFEENSIEHIHAPWASGPATAAMVASSLSGIPFSFSARAADIHPPDGALPEKMRAASFVRVNTAANRDYLSEIAPDCTDKIHLVYNNITLPAPACPPPAPISPPYRLLALGRFTEKKGYGYLLDACKALKDQGFPFHLTLAGDGGETSRLKAQCNALGLTDDVTMPGYMTHDAVPELMNGHHAFIMPSIVATSGDRDGIPNVIIEALCHHLPVVATDVGGISEVIRDGETGLLRPEKDAQALADAITSLFADYDHARELGKAGNALVQSLFDSVQNTGQLAELFDHNTRPSDIT